MNKINDYYLVIEKIIDLPSPKRNMIMDMYRDMAHSASDTHRKVLVESYFNTLEMGGYIKNRTIIEREDKINGLVNE